MAKLEKKFIAAEKAKKAVATKPQPQQLNGQQLNGHVEGSIAWVCSELQALQRMRVALLRSLLRQQNNLRFVVATSQGYHSKMPSEERLARMEASDKFIADVVESGVTDHSSPICSLIVALHAASSAFDVAESGYKTKMINVASKLPVASWVENPQQRGFGLLSLASIVGETGDLTAREAGPNGEPHNYPNPAKLWRRMGCAPWTFEGKTLMGSTWRFGKEGHLPVSEWTEYGYNPRRRSVVYLIGENIVKQNKSIYREKYDKAKIRVAQQHPDYTPQRCHRHAMLLSSKMLLRNLWCEWNSRPIVDKW